MADPTRRCFDGTAREESSKKSFVSEKYFFIFLKKKIQFKVSTDSKIHEKPEKNVPSCQDQFTETNPGRCMNMKISFRM